MSSCNKLYSLYSPRQCAKIPKCFILEQKNSPSEDGLFYKNGFNKRLEAVFRSYTK